MACWRCGGEEIKIPCEDQNGFWVVCKSCGDKAYFSLELSDLIDKKLGKKKEEKTMKVSYNGFTGELVKLERKVIPGTGISTSVSSACTYNVLVRFNYDLSIYDSEKNVTHSFENVKLSDVKFIGGSVSFE